MRRDYRFLVAKEWRGARLASRRLRSPYRCGAYDA